MHQHELRMECRVCLRGGCEAHHHSSCHARLVSDHRLQTCMYAYIYVRIDVCMHVCMCQHVCVWHSVFVYVGVRGVNEKTESAPCLCL